MLLLIVKRISDVLQQGVWSNHNSITTPYKFNSSHLQQLHVITTLDHIILPLIFSFAIILELIPHSSNFSIIEMPRKSGTVWKEKEVRDNMHFCNFNLILH